MSLAHQNLVFSALKVLYPRGFGVGVPLPFLGRQVGVWHGTGQGGEAGTLSGHTSQAPQQTLCAQGSLLTNSLFRPSSHN